LLVEKGTAKESAAAAYWVWSDAHAAQAAPPQTVWFRRSFEITEMPGEAIAIVNADNAVRLWLNGQSVRRQNDTPWDDTTVVDLRPHLRRGRNVIAAEAVNGGDAPNPAGFLAYLRFRAKAGDGKAEASATAFAGAPDLGTDGSWLVSTNKAEGWMKPEFDASTWTKAQVLGPPETAPWNLGAQFASVVHGRTAFGTVRSSLVSADPLATALGRPNREQVTSVRPQLATTLQMLELTNGGTLARLLKQGAEKLASENPNASNTVVDQVFRQGLGRQPTPTEARLAAELLGSPVRPEGVEDLVWSLAMLPEFQLIY
jgi:hypothetical protein